MLRALIRKKVLEFRAGKGSLVFAFLLLAVSLLPLFRLAFGTPAATFLPLLLIILVGWFLGPGCALAAFHGDFANHANRFLEYLPLRRSAIWLASYVSGLALLFLSAVALLWVEVILFPLGAEADAARQGALSDADLSYLTYLLPGRCAAVVSCGSILFWLFSVAAFPAACLERTDSPAANTVGAIMMMGSLFMPIAVIVALTLVRILPSGLALSPVLLTSGVLFSAGSYALFALAPKHITPAKRALLGTGLFLAIFAGLMGQLYVQHFAWRVLDPSLPLMVGRVWQPHPGDPNLLLAQVLSYRSGVHCVSIQPADGTYHDLGRGLAFLDVPEDDSGLLHFGYAPYSGGDEPSPSDWRYFVSMERDGTRTRSLKLPGHTWDVQWLPGKRLLVYVVGLEDSHGYRHDLCVADSNGRLLKRFEIGDGTFLVNAAGEALALAPTARVDDGAADGARASEENPYMIIDLESESVRRFGLPGPAECFAKDLRRVICSRIRIRDGRRYTSFVLIDLPTMFERSILSEDDLPAEEVTSQVDLAVNARISTDRMISTAADRQTRDLMVNDAFDTALWVKQRVDGDQFRYSIVLVDLNTGKRQEVVPESATVPMPVVMAKGTGGWPTALERFNADQTGFLYAIGPRTYFCEIRNRQSVLLADSSIHVDGDEEDTQRSPHGGSYYPTVCSPSGRRALRFANVYEKSRNDERRPRLRFAAIEVFQDAKPVRLYTGQRPITAAGWLDDERIVFQEKDTVYVLESAGGPPRQVFPPVGSTDSE